MTMIHSQRIAPAARLFIAAAIAVILSVPSSAQITNGVKLFKGVVNDTRTGQPVDGGRVWVYQGSLAEPVSNSKINPGTGKYQVILNPSTEYRFVMKSPKYYTSEVRITTPPGTDYEETIQDLTMEMIPLGSTIFSGRMFDPGASQFKVSPEFQKIVELMNRQKGIMVAVAITPDALAPEVKPVTPPKAPKKKGKKGAAPVAAPAPEPAPVAMTEDQLKALGQDQAVAIKNYFKDQGISTTRIQWDVKPGIIITGGKNAVLPNDVIVTINKIEVEDDEE
jgi:hypothetical protein